jgi:glycosyltransferase involved in cell wall biosynthesis
VVKVSVVLPVYNGEEYLRASLDSIFSQTYSDFELIIINDGSTDGSKAILDSINDRRVRVYHQENIGLAATLNRGVKLARGEYVARQDQDDVSYPERLEKQVRYLDANPECALLGTRAEIWVGNKKTERAHDHLTECADLRFDLLFDNPFVHSSVMFRKDVVCELGGYAMEKSRQPPEDYELWSRIARVAYVGNLPERLVAYREVPKSMSRASVNPFLEKVLMISAENLAWQIGAAVNLSTCRDITALMHGVPDMSSGNVNLKDVCRGIELAASGIENQFPGANLGGSVRQRCAIVRYQYYSKKWYMGPLRLLLRIARKGKAFTRMLIRISTTRS